MSYKKVEIKGKNVASVTTEMLFEIATAKTEQIDLIRFDFILCDDDIEPTAGKRLVLAVIKKLKEHKRAGKIQFFATPQSFFSSSTEAVFLLNKYPSVLDEIEAGENRTYIYVKI
jgi:hypothetical protein